MGGQHRLGPLHVRVAGQDHVAVPLGRRHERPLKADQPRVDPVERLAHPELDVGRDLVVAAPRGMQLAADVSQFLDQRRLDVHVDIFALQDERKIAHSRFQPGFPTDARTICWHSSVVSKPTRASMSRMGDRTPDILLEEPTIEGDRFA